MTVGEFCMCLATTLPATPDKRTSEAPRAKERLSMMDEARWKALEADLAKQPEFEVIGRMMEEMANRPDPGPYVRQPGERCSYEKQRIENAKKD